MMKSLVFIVILSLPFIGLSQSSGMPDVGKYNKIQYVGKSTSMQYNPKKWKKKAAKLGASHYTYSISKAVYETVYGNGGTSGREKYFVTYFNIVPKSASEIKRLKALESETTTKVENKYKLVCSNLLEHKTVGKYDVKTLEVREALVISDDEGQKGLEISFIGYGSAGISMYVLVSGVGCCIDEGSKMNILFRDGTRLDLTNASKFEGKTTFISNISGKMKSTSYYDITGKLGLKKEFVKLLNREIETMRVWTTDGFVEMDFTPKQSNQICITLDCIMRTYNY